MRQIAKELDISPAYLSYMVNGKRPWRKDLNRRYMGVVNTFVNSLGIGDVEANADSAIIRLKPVSNPVSSLRLASSVPVAQGIERLPSKQRVVGSNPTWGTI